MGRLHIDGVEPVIYVLADGGQRQANLLQPCVESFVSDYLLSTPPHARERLVVFTFCQLIQESWPADEEVGREEVPREVSIYI